MSDVPKILLFDIETSYNIGWFWSSGRTNFVTPEQILQERQIICISYMWLTDRKPKTLTWSRTPGPGRDKKLLEKFSEIFEEADSVVGHNSNRYDIPMVKGRLLFHGLDPLPPTHQVDTLMEARRLFRLNSNKLDYIDKFIGGEGKKGCGIDAWHAIIQNNCPDAMKDMVKYCEQDVLVLKNVYQKIWSHTARTRIGASQIVEGRAICKCGSTDVQYRGKYTTGGGYSYRRFKCKECGKWDKEPYYSRGD